MVNILIGLVFLSALASPTFAGYFTIIAPGTHQLGKLYRVHLVATGYKHRRDLEISLISGKYQLEVKTVTLINDLEENVVFDFVVTKNIIALTLKAKYAYSTEQLYEQSIKVIAEKYSVLIQTDKAVYKPGDMVQFRVIVLDAEFKPYSYNSLNITITDSLQEIITTRNASKSKFSVHEDSLKLADDLNLGKCEIRVIIDGDKNFVTQSFEIANFWLPEFKVTVETVSKDVFLSAGKINGHIFANYAFENGSNFVKGVATLEAAIYDPDNKSLSMTNIQVQGSGNEKRFLIDFKKDIKIQENLKQTLVKLKATFRDDLTGKSQVGSASFTVHKREGYAIEVDGSEPFITQNQPFTVKVTIRSNDDKHGNENKRVRFKLGYFIPANKCSNALSAVKAKKLKTEREFKKLDQLTQHKHLSAGVANFTVNAPEKMEAMLFSIAYEGNNYEEKVYRLKTKCEGNLALAVTSSLKLGEPVVISVTSKHMISKLHSVVIGRSGIVHAQTDNVGEVQLFNLTFKVLTAMLPSSELIVFYTRKCGEVVFDEVELNFEANFINITAPKLAKPGEKVSISIKTTPNSFVGLMITDQRSSFFRADKVIEDIVLKQRFLFNQSSRVNTAILTNAFRSNCTLKRLDLIRIHHLPLSDENIMVDRSYGAVPWIFKSFTADRNGKIILQETLPPTMTSYIVTGFSINAETGFSFANPIQLKASKNFFVQVNFASSAYVDEVVKVDAFIFTSNATDRNLKIIIRIQTNDKRFEIMESSTKNMCNFTPANKTTQQLNVVLNGTAKSHFFIRPKQPGLLKIFVTAQIKGKFRDDASRDILVHPCTIEDNGIKVGKVKEKLFDLRRQGHDSRYFPMPPDDRAAENSSQLEAFVFGKIIFPELTAFLDQPFAAAEDNLALYMATAFSVQFLKASKQRENVETDRNKLLKGLEFVKSKKLGGGYVDAGETVPSVKATAKIAKFLGITAKLVPDLESDLFDVLYFLTYQQERKGTFGSNSNNVSEQVSETAFIATAFLENSGSDHKYKNTIKKALNFICSMLDDIKGNNYVLAVSAYALAFGKHVNATRFVEKLFQTAIVDREYMFWNETSSSEQISTAAYAILALDKLGRIAETPKIMNWLLTKRNENGGFQSNEDTVVAIQAVAAMAVHFHSENQNLHLHIYNEGEFKIPIHIDDNYQPQSYYVPNPTGATVNANGTGFAFVQMTQKYHTKIDKEDKFHVTVTSSKNVHSNFTLKVCIRNKYNSKMVTAEVTLPSGYEFDASSFNKSEVKSFNTGKNISLIVFKLDNILKESPSCLNIHAIPFFFVSSSALLPVKVYDDEDQAHYTIKYYSSENTLC